MGQEQQDRGTGEIDTDAIEVNLPYNRPILLTNKAEIEVIKEKLSQKPYAEMYQALSELAYANPAGVTPPLAAAADVDPRLFDIGWQLVGMESVLPAAGLMYHLTGDTSYSDYAQTLLKKALNWTQWSDGRHTSVDGYFNAAPETASGMRAFAWTLDFLGDQLPPDTRLACQKKLAFLAQRLYEISVGGETTWARNVFDDWSASIHSALGQTALTLYDFDDRAKAWLKQAIKQTVAYLDSMPEDGGHPSGIARWQFALTHCCTFLEALYRCTGTDLRRHVAIERTRRFAIRCLAPGGDDIVQIDQGLPLAMDNVISSPISKLLAKWFEDPVIAWGIYRQKELGFTEATDLLWYDESLPQISPGEADECSRAFPDIGWVIMRSGWGEEHNLVAYKNAPYWSGYHHLDQGSFVIFHGDVEMAMDSGLGWRAHPNYFDRYRDSMAHNVILVNGKGQLKHTPETSGKLIKTEISDHADYAVGDCSASYERVNFYKRELLFLKPDILIIRDHIELDGALTVDWLLHGNGQLQVHTREQDRGFTIANESAAIQGYVLQPRRWKHSLRRGYKLSDWDTRHEVTHPVLTLQPEKSSSYNFLILIRIGEPSQARVFPGQVLGDGSLRIDAGDNYWSVRIAADGLEYRLI